MYQHVRNYTNARVTASPIIGYAVLQCKLDGNISTVPLYPCEDHGDITESNRYVLLNILPVAAPTILEITEKEDNTLRILKIDGTAFPEETTDKELAYMEQQHVPIR